MDFPQLESNLSQPGNCGIEPSLSCREKGWCKEEQSQGHMEAALAPPDNWLYPPWTVHLTPQSPVPSL